VDGISQEIQAASHSTATWNWPNLTRNNALQFALHAYPMATKERKEAVGGAGSISDEFSDVIESFQSAASAMAAAPWPPSRTHPPVTEVAVNLGLIAAQE
jgi:hypothetical protein